MDIFAFIQCVVCYAHRICLFKYPAIHDILSCIANNNFYINISDMGKLVIKNGIKWDYDSIWNRYTFIEKVEEKPKKKKKGEDV